MEDIKMDEHGALAIVSSIVKLAVEKNILEGTVMNDMNLDEVLTSLERAIGLLDDFKLWYSLDAVTQCRGKNKLSYLSEYYHKLHPAEEE